MREKKINPGFYIKSGFQHSIDQRGPTQFVDWQGPYKTRESALRDRDKRGIDWVVSAPRVVFRIFRPPTEDEAFKIGMFFTDLGYFLASIGVLALILGVVASIVRSFKVFGLDIWNLLMIGGILVIVIGNKVLDIDL